MENKVIKLQDRWNKATEKYPGLEYLGLRSGIEYLKDPSLTSFLTEVVLEQAKETLENEDPAVLDAYLASEELRERAHYVKRLKLRTPELQEALRKEDIEGFDKIMYKVYIMSYRFKK